MKKEKKKPVEVGAVATVEILKNEVRGKGQICRVDGMLGFINIPENKFIVPRSVWQVEVVEIVGKACVVEPIERVKTAWENMRDIDLSIMKLRKPKAARKKKPFVKYTNV